MSLRTFVKRTLISQGPRPLAVLTGAFRGLRMEIDLQSAAQFWMGLYERETYRWMYRFGADCSSGIDVGAAKGEFALFLLRKTSATTIFAFDPDGENEAIFSRNLELNGFASDRRLTRLRKFVGAGADGSMRLDSFAPRLASPIIVKVDVDGFELSVLEGMVGLLEEFKVRLLLETHSAKLEEECDRYLRRRGCATRIVKNAWWRKIINDQRPIEVNRWLVASNDPSCPV